MPNALLALFLAGGVGAFTYTKMAPRVGYGNTQNVVVIVGIVTIMTFVISLITLALVF